MYIDDFIWLPDIVEKLAAKHNVRPHFRFLESGYRPGEDVYGVLGQTDGGRYLIVFFIYKPDRLALILSARDMDEKERRRYERR
jgi:uncharacterized DUF497 family protein